MPTFTYVGIFDTVDIQVHLDTWQVAHGEPFDVPTDLAPYFLEQPENFAPTTSSTPDLAQEM